MKKIFNLMLIAVLTLISFIPSVSAVINTDTTGTITIKETLKDKTYTIYQVFKLESYDDTNNNGKIDNEDGYIYSVSSDWLEFVNRSDINKIYLEKDSENQIIEIKNDADWAKFAEKALDYATTKGLTGTSKTAQADNEVLTFSGLNLGYYVVDSTAGALCNLTTTRPDAEVVEKNSDPTVTKTVKEDSETNPENEYGTTNTADIGDTVSYKTVIKVGKGAQNYVLTDTMSEGLTFTSETLEIKIGSTEVAAENYTLTIGDGTAEKNYTFKIEFDNEYTYGLAEDTEIVVTYDAVVDTDAVVGGNGNTNTADLTYGDDNALSSTTTTFTYSFDLVKTDEADILLDGATFKLYEELGDNDRLIKFTKVDDHTYRVNPNGQVTEIVVKDGKVLVTGLDAADYYLVETDNPDGYAKLLGPVDLTIDEENLVAEFDQENANKYTDGGVRVINTKGNLLPSTGGIGTTLFIVIGSLMVTLFGVLLVTKARMSKMDI